MESLKFIVIFWNLLIKFKLANNKVEYLHNNLNIIIKPLFIQHINGKCIVISSFFYELK